MLNWYMHVECKARLTKEEAESEEVSVCFRIALTLAAYSLN